MNVVVIADAVDQELGLLGPFLADVGASTRYLDRADLRSERVSADLLLLLGSNRSAHATSNSDTVRRETDLIRGALDGGTPTLGICYGAQVLSRALGGSSDRGPAPECGWVPVQSRHPELCPPGRWGQMHHDIMIPAPTTEVIGWSRVGPQAIIDDSFGARALGWQFHPEMTIPTFERWLRWHYSGSERADVSSILAEAQIHAQVSARRAAPLFAAAFSYLGVSGRRKVVAP